MARGVELPEQRFWLLPRNNVLLKIANLIPGALGEKHCYEKAKHVFGTRNNMEFQALDVGHYCEWSMFVMSMNQKPNNGSTIFSTNLQKAHRNGQIVYYLAAWLGSDTVLTVYAKVGGKLEAAT